MDRPPREDDVTRELRAHVELEIEQRMADGAKPADARAAALHLFGNPVAIREQVRDLSPWTWWERLMQDVRYGLRAFRRSPAFTTTAVLSLALGIGANSAIFAVVNAALLRSLPVSHPEQLVAVRDASFGNFSYPAYVALRRDTHTLSDLIAASSLNKAVVGIGGETEQAAVKMVSGNYFAGFGVLPSVGRVLATPDETEPVAVISRGYWLRRFNESPGVLGQTIRVNGASFTIVGVGPAGFSGEAPGESPEIWTSLALQPPSSRNERGFTWLYLMGRLRAGETPGAAQADLAALLGRPGAPVEGTPHVVVSSGANGSSKLQDRFADPLQALMVIAGLVLLIACTNLASLLLTRGDARRGEIAMRLAIGATRARVVRQLLTESLLLAAMGGALGMVCAEWGSAALLRIASAAGADVSLDVRPDVRTLLFTGAVSLAAGLLFGLVPALRAVRYSAASLAAEGGQRLVGAGRRWRSRDAIIAVQIALSLILLAGCGMFVRTLRNLESQDLGFRSDGVLVVEVLRERGYRPALDTVVPRLIERAAAVPGVDAASVALGGTLANAGGITGLDVEGYVPRDPQDKRARADWVGPAYFRTAGIPLAAGRDFLPTDRDTAQKVAIINQAMARHYFGDAAAVGRHVTWNKNEYEIVGVAKNAKYSDLRELTLRVIYFSLLQGGAGFGSVEVRTSGANPMALAPMIRAAIREVDPRLSAGDMTTLSNRVDRKLGREHLVADLAGFFGTLTLVLLSVGVYGTLAYTVGRRTKEIGVRLALGARRRAVIWMVLRQVVIVVAIGVIVGVAGVLAVGRLVTPLLFGVAPGDPATIAAAAGLLIAVAMVAGALPALAASRLDPATVLRE
jgi:predicted permease